MDAEIIILPCHTGQPVPFKPVPLASSLESSAEKVPALCYDEEQFIVWILERLPANPPNNDKIVELNERG